MEVVVALLVLEVAVVAAVGTLTVASRTLTEADRLERMVADAEGVLDSLAGESWPTVGTLVQAGSEVSWVVDSAGRADVRAVTPVGDTVFTLVTVLGQ